jgi:hypothetical protein
MNDLLEATRSILKVGDGRGFVAWLRSLRQGNTAIVSSVTSLFFLQQYARARVMGSYISNRNVCAQTWNLFNDDRCTLPENWTRML